MNTLKLILLTVLLNLGAVLASESIALEIKPTIGKKSYDTIRVIAEEGKVTTVELDKTAKFELIASIKDDDLYLDFKIYSLEQDNYELIGEPALVAKINEPTKVKVGMAGKTSYSLELKGKPVTVTSK